MEPKDYFQPYHIRRKCIHSYLFLAPNPGKKKTQLNARTNAKKKPSIEQSQKKRKTQKIKNKKIKKSTPHRSSVLQVSSRLQNALILQK